MTNQDAVQGREQAHTPEPWEYVEILGARMSYIGNREHIVAGIPNPTGPDEDMDLQTQRANALLIVQAVNERAENKRKLEAAGELAAVARMAAKMPGCICHVMKGTEMCLPCRSRAALAAWEGR